MRRNELIKHLVGVGCVFVREGARHTVFFNPIMKRVSTVSRHTEVNNFLARKICRDLGIMEIKKR